MKLRLLNFLLAACAAGCLIFGAFIMVMLPGLPDSNAIRDISLKVPLRIYTAEGHLIAEYGEEKRHPILIDDAPDVLIKAVLASEDDAFYRHRGIDFKGIVRAAISNVRGGARRQGASTITMQVARNFFLTPERTYVRKLREMLLALRIENLLDKDEILELYLNKIFLGHRAYGFEAAAEVYYAKTLDELSLAEHAMLAGIPKAPSRNNPLTNPERASERRDYVLRRMRELGWIDEKQYGAATIAPLTAHTHRALVDVDAPYVAELARAEVVERFGEQAYWSGMRVYTTIRATRQTDAHRALRQGLMAYDRRHGYRGPVQRVEPAMLEDQDALFDVLANTPPSEELTPAVVLQTGEREATVLLKDGRSETLTWAGLSWAKPHLGPSRVGDAPTVAEDILSPGDLIYVAPRGDDPAVGLGLAQVPEVAGALVSLHPGDGAILALSGGFDYYLSKYNRATQAERQPGSNIKPFIYLAALDRGFTAASAVSGAPIVVEDRGRGTIWRPENYSGKFFGPTRLRKALSLSLNLVSVRVLRAIGIPVALDYLDQYGLDAARQPRGLSLALGTGTITPLDMASAYASLANGGAKVAPYLIDWVEDRDGKIVYQAAPMRSCARCRPSYNGRRHRPVEENGAAPQDLQHAQPDAATASLTPPDDVPAAVISDAEPDAAARQPLDAVRAGHRAPQVMRADNLFVLNSMLRDVIQAGTAVRAKSLNRDDLAGKTGTTNDFRDAWFSGYNKDIVTTVWVGFDQPRSLGRGESGSRAALPIWIDYMGPALEGNPSQHRAAPDNIVTRYINRDSARTSYPGDPDAFEEFFVVGTEPAFRAPQGDTFTESPAAINLETDIDAEEELF